MDPVQTAFDTGRRQGELDPERPEPFETPWGCFALYDLGDRVVAAQCWCPHLAGPLFQGSVRTDRVSCPWHSWVFSLDSGECVWAPDRETGHKARLKLLRVTVGPDDTYRIHPPPQ